MENTSGVKEEPNRREFLKSSLLSVGASGIAVSTMGVGAARESGLAFGSVVFVETRIEHEVSDDESLGDTDGLRRYSADKSRNHLGLIANPAVGLFSEADAVVGTGNKFSEAPATVFGNTTSVLTVDADYHRDTEKILFIESDYEQPGVEIGSIDGQQISGSVKDKIFSLEPGEEKSIILESKEVIVNEDVVRLGKEKKEPNTKSIEITPTCSIRNNGRVQVFGKKNHHIVPLNSDDPFAKRFKQAREDNPSAEKVEKNGVTLFVIEMEGENDD